MVVLSLTLLAVVALTVSDKVQATSVLDKTDKAVRSELFTPPTSFLPPFAKGPPTLISATHDRSQMPVPEARNNFDTAISGSRSDLNLVRAVFQTGSPALAADRHLLAWRTLRNAYPPATLAYVEAAVVEFARTYEWSQFAPPSGNIQLAPAAGKEAPDKPEIYYGYELTIECRVRLAHVDGLFHPTEKKCEYEAVTLYPAPLP